jgi:hypothetical protein
LRVDEWSLKGLYAVLTFCLYEIMDILAQVLAKVSLNKNETAGANPLVTRSKDCEVSDSFPLLSLAETEKGDHKADDDSRI